MMRVDILEKPSLEQVIKGLVFALIVLTMIVLAGQVGQLPDVIGDDAATNILSNTHCYSSCAFSYTFIGE